MRKQLALALGISGGIALCAAAWLGAPERDGAWDWRPSATEPQPVWVVIVPGRDGLDTVRRAIVPERIVAETPDVLVLREGRVVATSVEAVGAPLTELGWVERSIEIVSVGAERDDEAARPAHRPADGPDLAALARKPLLTLSEALALLDAGY